MPHLFELTVYVSKGSSSKEGGNDSIGRQNMDANEVLTMEEMLEQSILTVGYDRGSKRRRNHDSSGRILSISRFPRTVNENSIDKNSANLLKHFAEFRVYYIPTEMYDCIFNCIFNIDLFIDSVDGLDLKVLLILYNYVET